MRKLWIIVFALLALPSSAQNFMTVTSANIQGGGGTLLSSGLISFQPTDGSGNVIGYQVGGGGQAITWPTVCSISNGAITGSCQLPNVSLTNPMNVCFAATVKNGSNVIVILPSAGYSCVQPQTSNNWCSVTSNIGTCNFDQFIPNTPNYITAKLGPPQAGSLGGVYSENCNTGFLMKGILTTGHNNCVAAGTGGGGISGPGVTISGDIILWDAVDGTLVRDAGFGFPLSSTHIGTLAAGSNGLAQSAITDTTNANNITTGTLGHGRLPALVSGDIPNNAANTTGTSGGISSNITESQVTNLTFDLGNRALTSTTVNGHPLSSNVTVSASDLTTGTLPHPQLPVLVGGDIPNNSATTTGRAGGLSIGGTIAGLNDGCLNVVATVIFSTGQVCGFGAGMVWPAGGAGIPNYTGINTWGASYGVSGTGTTVALTNSPVFGGSPTVPGYVPTTTSVNGHALNANVTVSATDLTTGTLPHTQLPGLVSGDIPNNVANTTGTAGNLSGTPTLPTGTVLPGYTPTSTMVNGHALSSNVVVSASDLTTGTLPHTQLPALVSGDVPNNAANTSGTAANLSGTPTLPSGTVLPGYVPNTVTVNGHALSSNVTVSASDLTTGTLPHTQLPALVSGDIPNNAANTSGTAGNLSGAPALPSGTTCSDQAYADSTGKCANTRFVLANAFKSPVSGSSTSPVYNFNSYPDLGWYAALSNAQINVLSVIVPASGTTVYATMQNDSTTNVFSWPVTPIPGTFQLTNLTPTSGSLAALNNLDFVITGKSDPTDGTHTASCAAAQSCNVSFSFTGTMPAAGTYTLTAGTGSIYALWPQMHTQIINRLESSSGNPAKSGTLRLGHTDKIKYRIGTAATGSDAIAFGGWSGSGDNNRLQVGDTYGTIELGPKEVQDTLSLTKSTQPQQWSSLTLANPCQVVASQSSLCFQQTTGALVLSVLGGAFGPIGAGGSFTPGTDLSGTSTSQTVVGIEGQALPSLTAGFLNYTGAAWQYSTNVTQQGNAFNGSSQLVQTNGSGQIPASVVPTLNQSTTGNAATASALDHAPTNCTGSGGGPNSGFALGISANGNANCSNAPSSGVIGTSLATVAPTPNVSPGLSLTAASTVANTVTATSLLTTYVGSNVVRAGQMLPSVGGAKTARVHAAGKISTTGTPTFTVTVLLGGVTLSAIAVPGLTNLTAADWDLEYEFTVNGITTALAGGCFKFTGTGGAMFGGCASSAAASGLNFAADQAVDVKVTWGTASASNTVTANQLSASPQQRI